MGKDIRCGSCNVTFRLWVAAMGRCTDLWHVVFRGPSAPITSRCCCLWCLMARRHINAWVCRIYCHKVIKLSDAVQPLPRQETQFVHGVSPNFLQVGQAKAEAAAHGEEVWRKVRLACNLDVLCNSSTASLGLPLFSSGMRTGMKHSSCTGAFVLRRDGAACCVLAVARVSGPYRFCRAAIQPQHAWMHGVEGCLAAADVRRVLTSLARYCGPKATQSCWSGWMSTQQPLAET